MPPIRTAVYTRQAPDYGESPVFSRCYKVSLSLVLSLSLSMESTIFVPVPKTPNNEPTSRDDRLKIQTLYYTAGWSVSDILLQHPKLTRRQVDYALHFRPTPQKQRCGRHPLLSTPQRKRLISWATFSSLTRDIPRKELPRWLGWTCGEKAVRTAFKKEGYCRGIRRRTPPISPKN